MTSLASLLRSLPRLSRRTVTHGSMGLAVDGECLAAVVLDVSQADAPRLLACHRFAGQGALGAFRQWRRSEGWQLAPAHLLLGGDDYQLLPIETLELPAAELADAARWKVKDMIDFPAEQASVACVLVPKVDADAHLRQALAVVTPKATVAHWMQRAQQARCGLEAIDIPELALRNLLGLVHLNDNEACGLLHLGTHRATLVMVWQGELCTFRRLDVTLGHLLQADEERRATQIERLALDLQRTCDAFERQFHTAVLRRLWVTQPAVELNLVDALSRQLTLELHALDLKLLLGVEGPTLLVDPDNGVDFVPAIGAALRGIERRLIQ